MNCEQVRKFILEKLGEDASAELNEHLEQCDACRREFIQQMFIKDVLALRSYEAPKSGRVERGVTCVMREIKLREDKQKRSFEQFTWIFSEPRYGVVALMVICIGLNLVNRAPDPSQDFNADDQFFGRETLLLSDLPTNSDTNSYKYPEFDIDQIQSPLNRINKKVEFVNLPTK